MPELFQPPRGKLTIGSCEQDAQDLVLRAQYNPKELQLDMPVPWTEHGEEVVEFTGVACRSLTVELLFDGFEHRLSVQPELDVLVRLASPYCSDSGSHFPRRPHVCVVAWGERGIPPFRCVIESLATKYTMFGSDGAPLRAVATLKLKEVDLAKQRKHDAAERTPARGSGRRPAG